MNPEINQNNQNYDELINQLLQKHIFDKQAQNGINNNQDNTPDVKDEETDEPIQNQDIDNNPDMDQNRADKLTVANQNPNEVDPDEIANREINTASL